MYDIFYISNYENDPNWITVKERYPTAQRLENITSFDQIKSKAFTKMFWVIWDDVVLTDFDLHSYQATKWDDMYIHTFKNGDHYDGICLFPKNSIVSNKEFTHRFFVNKKEVDVIASTPKCYEKFYISTYEEYLAAIEDSKTEMFWVIWPDIEIIDDSIFLTYFNHHNDYDRKENHVFKNACDDKESYVSGIVLFSKKQTISSMEFKRRYLINKKEYPTVASRYRYRRYNVSSYDEYLEICKTETQPMFWLIWPYVEIVNDKVFDLYFDPLNGKYDYDRNENHVFKNACDDKESYMSGIVLCSKNKIFSKMEFTRRFLIDKKEHDILASRFRYKKYVIENYEQYLEICKTEPQPLFWAIWPEITVTNESVFDLYFDPRDGKYDYDRNENHVFHHIHKGKNTYHGLMLMSKNKIISAKELNFRFLIDKKEHDIVASKLTPYDIVFISYEESNADENYAELLKRFPRAKRIHHVKGIHNAHIAAAKLATTDMFWVVDGDAKIVDTFNFDFEVSRFERDIVHVWQSKNPINDLVYGYGGVKLLPTQMTIDMDTSTTDMTTSISKRFKAIPEVSNITAFDTDEFSAWKSAFRECVKLASRTINGQIDKETEDRLNVWCSDIGKDRPYGKAAIQGARAGRTFATKYPKKIHLINDFDWLKEKFNGR